ncbi:hypothetical protein L7F22_059495 [Adiantum nelumboides]|nr:hypothetical protein [Adiantum nelumboides]
MAICYSLSLGWREARVLPMALSRPPSSWRPSSELDLSSIAPSTHAAGVKGSSRSQLHCQCFNYRGLLPDAPPLQSAPQAPDASFHLPNVVAKVSGPASFEASKLNVMFLGVRKDEHPEDLPRIYTLTHCDLTAMLTLTVSPSINKAQLQGWYKRLQRDDVVAMWRRCQGAMSLHVHCHISGGHWFRDALARLRFHIFRRELPVVLKAFWHGDRALLKKHPELEKAPVWVYFHSNVKELDKVEYWGPLMQGGQLVGEGIMPDFGQQPAQCRVPCECCFPR